MYNYIKLIALVGKVICFFMFWFFLCAEISIKFYDLDFNSYPMRVVFFGFLYVIIYLAHKNIFMSWEDLKDKVTKEYMFLGLSYDEERDILQVIVGDIVGAQTIAEFNKHGEISFLGYEKGELKYRRLLKKNISFEQMEIDILKTIESSMKLRASQKGKK